MIGVVVLIGIVEEERDDDDRLRAGRRTHRRLDPRDAIYHACLLRFRPIMMTTMAAILGALPLMLGTGVGSELRHPLGITIVGGLIVSQLFTLNAAEGQPHAADGFELRMSVHASGVCIVSSDGERGDCFTATPAASRRPSRRGRFLCVSACEIDPLRGVIGDQN